MPRWAGDFLGAVEVAGDDVAAGLDVARAFGARLPYPGEGATATRWSLLAIAGAADLTATRVLEPHADALAILREAGETPPDGTWGVFAAETPDSRLEWTAGALSGTKPWCSLGDVLDHALVTAFVGEQRQLFAVDLDHASVHPDPPQRWVARGLSNVTSVALQFDSTPARPIGGPEWYLHRPGFTWGGMGVAACWLGGAIGLQQDLITACRGRSGELVGLHVGLADSMIAGARASLYRAAHLVDTELATGPAGELLMLRVRAAVAEAVERVITQVGHALGPGPLAFDERHARRVADLQLYVRQHHAERDLAALGRSVLDQESSVLHEVTRTGL
jgi:alkylation response protein AidB-like acyl-CoA dehydrogenase